MSSVVEALRSPRRRLVLGAVLTVVFVAQSALLVVHQQQLDEIQGNRIDLQGNGVLYGPSGSPGPSGPSGRPGPTGPRGVTGRHGKDGHRGRRGHNGRRGRNGMNGRVIHLEPEPHETE